MIAGICCTQGRYRCLQRALRCFLDQKYSGKSLMFICNSGSPLKLPDDLLLPDNKLVYIDNCSLMNFQSVGEKYAHALGLMMTLFPDVSIVFSQDDDDIFLPTHLSEGYSGINRAFLQDMEAYKPKLSYYRFKQENGDIGHVRNENTYEPSIFVTANWLRYYKYAPVSVRYHQQWLDPLIDQGKILIDPAGTSTLVYNWGDDWPTYKMSGSGTDNQHNFNAHKRNSLDMGNGILVPADDNSQYYKLENPQNF